MAGFTDLNKLDFAYKVLQRAAHTDEAKGALNESIPSKVVMAGSDIWQHTPPGTPPLIDTADIQVVADFTLTLRPDTNTAGTCWAAHSVPGDITSPINGNWVPPAYGTGYFLVLKDNAGGVVPAGSQINWQFDYGSGVLYIQDPAAVAYATPFHVVGYRYIGPTMSTAVNGPVGGPGAATDHALVRWDGNTGTLLEDSNWILSDTGAMIGNLDAVGIGIAPALLLRNTTAAANAAPQYTPPMILQGAQWDGAASHPTRWSVQGEMVQDPTAGLSILHIGHDVDGAGFASKLSLESGANALIGADILSAQFTNGSSLYIQESTTLFAYTLNDNGPGGLSQRWRVNSATPAANDFLQTIHHSGQNDFPSSVDYVTFTSQILSPITGAESSLYSVGLLSGAIGDSFKSTWDGSAASFTLEYVNTLVAGAPEFATFSNPGVAQAAGDIVGAYSFYAQNDAAAKTIYARMYGQVVDPVNATRSGRMVFTTEESVGLVEGLRIENRQALLQDGTAVLPALAFVTDPATGMYYLGGGANAAALGSHEEGKLFWNRFGVGVNGATSTFSMSVFGLPDTDHSPLGTLLIDAGNWSSSNLTASTGQRDIYYRERQKTWPTGDIALQVWADFESQTVAFDGDSTMSDGVTARFAPPRAGAHATITRGWGAKVDGLWSDGAYRLNTSVLGAGLAGGTYSILPRDHVLDVDTTTAGTLVISLPAAAVVGDGRVFGVKDSGKNASVNNITVDAAGADTVDGQANFIIASSGTYFEFYSDGVSDWRVR